MRFGSVKLMIQLIKQKLQVLHADPVMRELAIGSLFSFALKLGGSALAFAFNVVVARMLGAEGAGIYFLALSIITIAAIIGRAGLDQTLMRYVATYAVQNQWGAVVKSYQYSIRIVILVSCLCTLVVFLLAPWLSGYVFNKQLLADPLRWLSLSILPLALLNLHAEALKGIKNIRDAQLSQSIGQPLASLFVIYPMAIYAGTVGVALSTTIATTIVAILSTWAWHRSIEINNIGTGSVSVRQIISSGKLLFAASIINSVIIPWTPFLLLGIWSSAEDIGIFGMATRVAMLVSILLVTINNVVAPKFAELHIKGELVALGMLARRTAFSTLLLATPLLVLLLLFSRQTMGLFGQSFISGAATLQVLVIAQFINAATGSVGYLLIMSGHEKSYKQSAVVSMCVMLILSVWLIPIFGAFGAALSGSTAVILNNIFWHSHVRRLLGINTLHYWK